MSKFLQKHKVHWSYQPFVISTIWGVLLFSVSLFINYFANNYATEAAKSTVTDLILSNTPVWNVGWVLTYGTTFVILLALLLLIIKPEKIPFTLKAASLFIIIRAVFISITHIAQFTPQAPLNAGEFLNFIGTNNQGGLFFSGHTGFPFLLALIFWKHKNLRLVFLAISVIFGASVLLGHLHYSIDVLGAFFITYTIFSIAQKFFAKDYLLFHHELDH